MASVSISTPENNHSYCLDCDWAATPDKHRFADVHTDSIAHGMFNPGHTTRSGATGEIIDEARSRLASFEESGSE